MKSKPNTHSVQASGKKHTVSILISLTESRNVASVTHHLPSLLSFDEVEKDGEDVNLVGVKRGKLLEIEDVDRKGQRQGFLQIVCHFHIRRIRNIIQKKKELICECKGQLLAKRALLSCFIFLHHSSRAVV